MLGEALRRAPSADAVLNFGYDWLSVDHPLGFGSLFTDRMGDVAAVMRDAISLWRGGIAATGLSHQPSGR